MMEQRFRVGNRLLAALPPADLDLLAPYLRKVPLERDAVLVRSGDPIDQIYFPCSGTIAFIMEMPNGQTVANAVVGNEGAVGILTSLDPSLSWVTAVVRVPGTALQISPARFHPTLRQSRGIRRAVQTHTRALLAQFQHVAACNALHSVEARLARWLLHIHDRVDGDVLPLTQEALSELLGVRRTTVTHVVRKLRTSHAIRDNRRSFYRDRQTEARSRGMRVLPDTAPQNRADSRAGRHQTAQPRPAGAEDSPRAESAVGG